MDSAAVISLPGTMGAGAKEKEGKINTLKPNNTLPFLSSLRKRNPETWKSHPGVFLEPQQ